VPPSPLSWSLERVSRLGLVSTEARPGNSPPTGFLPKGRLRLSPNRPILIVPHLGGTDRCHEPAEADHRKHPAPSTKVLGARLGPRPSVEDVSADLKLIRLPGPKRIGAGGMRFNGQAHWHSSTNAG
jgi:hypothetical protein